MLLFIAVLSIVGVSALVYAGYACGYLFGYMKGCLYAAEQITGKKGLSEVVFGKICQVVFG